MLIRRKAGVGIIGSKRCIPSRLRTSGAKKVTTPWTLQAFNTSRNPPNTVLLSMTKILEENTIQRALNSSRISRAQAKLSFLTTVRVKRAHHTLISDFCWILAVRRHRPGDIESDESKRQPVNQVHVDQTPESATARVHRHLPADEAERLVKKRFQIINLWRPISHPAIDHPLALCDYRTVDVNKDLVPVTLVYPDRKGETFGVKFNSTHGWKYEKGMKQDETVLIKWFADYVLVCDDALTLVVVTTRLRMTISLNSLHIVGSRIPRHHRECRSGSLSSLGR
jgi:hypothetical protein